MSASSVHFTGALQIPSGRESNVLCSLRRRQSRSRSRGSRPRRSPSGFLARRARRVGLPAQQSAAGAGSCSASVCNIAAWVARGRCAVDLALNVDVPNGAVAAQSSAFCTAAAVDRESRPTPPVTGVPFGHEQVEAWFRNTSTSPPCELAPRASHRAGCQPLRASSR